jgi:hypothetical protein
MLLRTCPCYRRVRVFYIFQHSGVSTGFDAHVGEHVDVPRGGRTPVPWTSAGRSTVAISKFWVNTATPGSSFSCCLCNQRFPCSLGLRFRRSSPQNIANASVSESSILIYRNSTWIVLSAHLMKRPWRMPADGHHQRQFHPNMQHDRHDERKGNQCNNCNTFWQYNK